MKSSLYRFLWMLLCLVALSGACSSENKPEEELGEELELAPPGSTRGVIREDGAAHKTEEKPEAATSGEAKPVATPTDAELQEAAQSPHVAAGKLGINDTDIPLVYAYARRKTDSFRNNQEMIEISLTNIPLKLERMQTSIRWVELQQEGLRYIRFQIEPPRDLRKDWYLSITLDDERTLSDSPDVTLDITAYNEHFVKGRISTNGKHPFRYDSYSFDVAFSTIISSIAVPTSTPSTD